MKVINKISRNNLGEGRSSRLGFSFAKKVDDNTLQTVYAISPCKDYLNDVVFSETTGKPCSAHGCHAKKEGTFDEGVFLAMRICLNKYGRTPYKQYEEDKQNLNKNILNIVKFLNIFEERFGIEGRTEAIKIDEYEDVDNYKEDVHVFLVPKDWIKATFAISLYTLLLRMAMWYDGKQDVDKYLEEYKEEDVYLFNPVKPVLKLFAEKGIPEQDMSKLTPGGSVHNYGISTYVYNEKIQA